jgi:hypothetical protein
LNYGGFLFDFELGPHALLFRRIAEMACHFGSNKFDK